MRKLKCPIEIDGTEMGEPIELGHDNGCPACGKVLDAATSVGDIVHVPEDGDASVCAYCGNLMAFNKDGTLRPMTDAEFKEASTNKHVLAIQSEIARRERYRH